MMWTISPGPGHSSFLLSKAVTDLFYKIISFVAVYIPYKCSVTCDVTELMREKCHPPQKDHEAWFVDPLKFEVDLPQYKDDIFVAVISDLRADGFRLHEVYRQQKSPSILHLILYNQEGIPL